MSLPKLLAGAVASLLMSLIWFLASPKDAPTPSADELAALRTPVTVTLNTGERVSGELLGPDALCADWQTVLQSSPETEVTLPNGRTLHGTDVRSLSVGRSPVEGLEGLGKVSACGEVLTVHAVGSPAAGLDVLQNAGNSAGEMGRALKTLTSP